MQPTSAKYIAKSIQDDRLVAAARDRQLLGVASDHSKTTHAGIRTVISSAFAALAARVTPATQH